VVGVPGKMIKILERESKDYNETLYFTGKKIKALNVGSYNYLGFAKNKGLIIDQVLAAVDKYPINYASKTFQCNIIKKLEKEIAEFIYQEDCMVLSMGYGTNTSTIPILMSDSLIFSDELNHMSLIKGMKLSKSKIVIFGHNDMNDLECKLRHFISQGQPDTYKPWRKIFVVVEGLYSMEGTIVRLKKLVELKKTYKFYIYVDEAHSIGALGKTGRGVCEHLDVNFSEVDIHMGTFSKSFGGFGGYIAGSKSLINFLKNNNSFYKNGESMSPIVATQILFSLRELIKNKAILKRLHYNNRMLRKALEKKRFYLLGDKNSAIVPILIPSPGKIGDFSRLCLDRRIAVVVVGYPATPVLLNRVRLCVSAAHTKKDIQRIIEVIDQIGGVIGMKK
jgi:serine palmitoyltransferase